MIKTIKEQQNHHSWPNIVFKIKILKSHITVNSILISKALSKKYITL